MEPSSSPEPQCDSVCCMRALLARCCPDTEVLNPRREKLVQKWFGLSRLVISSIVLILSVWIAQKNEIGYIIMAYASSGFVCSVVALHTDRAFLYRWMQKQDEEVRDLDKAVPVLQFRTRRPFRWNPFRRGKDATYTLYFTAEVGPFMKRVLQVINVKRNAGLNYRGDPKSEVTRRV